MNNPTNDPIDDTLLTYTGDLMAGLEQIHFPKEQQTAVYKARQSIEKLLIKTRIDEIVQEVKGTRDKSYEGYLMTRLDELQDQLNKLEGK